MDELKARAKTLPELAASTSFLLREKTTDFTEKAIKLLDDEGKALLSQLVTELEKIDNFTHDNLELVMKNYCESEDLKLGKVMGVIRAAITGSHMSPSMFKVLEALGKENTINRLNHIK